MCSVSSHEVWDEWEARLMTESLEGLHEEKWGRAVTMQGGGGPSTFLFPREGSVAPLKLLLPSLNYHARHVVTTQKGFP